MAAIRKILVPVDFSDCSRDALRYAVELPLEPRPALTLLHVYQIPAYYFPDTTIAGHSLQSEIESRVWASLAGYRRDAERWGAAEVSTEQSPGLAAAEIARIAAEGGHDLIVMGTHGHTGVKHALLGSVAERVVRKAPCPVLTVRSNAQ